MRYITSTRVFVLIMLLLALGLWAMTDYDTNLPEHLSKHETIVLGQSRLVPASQAAMRVVVRDSREVEGFTFDVERQDVLMGDGTTEPVEAPILLTAQEASAQAALADVSPRGALFTLEANSHHEAIENSREQQQTYFSGLSIGLYILLLLIPLVIFGMTIYSVYREKRLARSLAFAVSIIVLLAGALMLWPMPDSVNGPLERFGHVMEWLADEGAIIGIALLLSGPISFLLLVWNAWQHKRQALSWALTAIPLFIVVLFLTLYAIAQGDVQPSEQIFFVGAIVYLLFPLTFMIRAAAFALTGHRFLAVATVVVALFIFISPLVVIIANASIRIQGTTGMVEQEVVMEDAIPIPQLVAEGRLESASGKGVTVENEADSNTNSAGKPPRLRQYFPETMLWLPDGVTDEAGLLQLDVPVADRGSA